MGTSVAKELNRHKIILNNQSVERKFESLNLNPISANPQKWLNTLKQFADE